VSEIVLRLTPDERGTLDEIAAHLECIDINLHRLAEAAERLVESEELRTKLIHGASMRPGKT
jgi:hypothetical protein